MREEKTEILIIGSEAAGAKAAIEAQQEGADVIVVTKGLKGRSGSTILAGTGIQAPIGHDDPRDGPDVFFEDVIKGGAFLNNQKLVERLVGLAVTEIPKMAAWGAKFRKIGDKFVQFRTPGATYARSLLPEEPAGHQYRKAFSSQFKRLNTRIMEDVIVTRLQTSEGQASGALAFSLRDGEFIALRAKATIIATGGCGQIYLMTDTSRDATGDGMNMAYEIGAELMDMEFQQFFPYSFYGPPFHMETLPAGFRYYVRGILYNALGEAFMEKYLPKSKDFGLRDATSRAIYLENMAGRGGPHGGAYISVKHLPKSLVIRAVNARNPSTLPKLEKAGIDIFNDGVECGPSCHYTMGGIRVNERCETSVPRLYAAGEAAAGMDGAERIDGGPAITWCLTMGYIAGKEAARKVRELDWLPLDATQVQAEQERVAAIMGRKEGIRGVEVKNKVKDIMWRHAALVRDGKGLHEGLGLLQQIKSDDLSRLSATSSSPIFNKGLTDALEAVHMTEVAELVTRAALMREESRRSHYRTDFLDLDQKRWLCNTVIKREGAGASFTTVPVEMTRMAPSETEGVWE